MIMLHYLLEWRKLIVISLTEHFKINAKKMCCDLDQAKWVVCQKYHYGEKKKKKRANRGSRPIPVKKKKFKPKLFKYLTSQVSLVVNYWRQMIMFQLHRNLVLASCKLNHWTIIGQSLKNKPIETKYLVINKIKFVIRQCTSAFSFLEMQSALQFCPW